ncbi:MAG: glycosyl hydrolase family 18 protein, partial [Bacteroidales bacterium]|nr:glycosyl hydrolase family 18 protein [Bacteroidales bacterium]
NYNLAKTLNYYQSQGASRQKIILGLPYYGREWNTEGSTVPSNTTSSVSSRTYKAIKDNTSGNYSNRQWEEKSFTPYYTYYLSNWRQCFCDDEISLGYRYDLVNMMGIAGIGIWALGNDDGYTELWDLIQNKFTNCATYPCNGTFYDLGGPYKDYYDNSDYTFTIAPTDATQVSLEFPVFDIEAGSGTECNYDYLEVFDGVSSASTSLGKFCNTTGNPGTITSSGNALTVKVHTDGATTKSGFKGVWSCIQDNILPETSVTANQWVSEDFIATFTDTDNEAVDMKFYQVLDNDGVEWRANNNYGFFNDNFQNEIHADWTDLSGTWSINNGHLMQSDESVSNNNIYANVTQVTGNTYLYHWQMKIDGAGDNRRAGLYFYCSNPELEERGNAYMIYFRADQNACQIYKCTDNVLDIHTDDPVNVNAGTWYDYKVIFNTNTGEIKAYQNNVLISSWTDQSPHNTGNSISLRTGNCNVEYDDIKVYKNRNSTETITVGANEEVRYQNIGETNSACRIKTIITDISGNISTSNGTDVNIDWTAPEDIASVNDGLGLDIDTTYIGTSLSANWTQANEPNSYVSSYEYCVGLTSGASDVVDWTDNGILTSVTHTDLTLISETEYFFSIRATNITNLTSNITSSDGVLYIDPQDFTIADFEFGNTGICEGQAFSLINYSVNANSYFWTISGPVNLTSTDENPEFLPEEGEYTVKLVAYGNLSNDSVTKTAEITIQPNPVANFSAIETNLELSDATAFFINNSEHADIYLWEFGDGETSSLTEPWHTYTSTGLFTVRLEAFSYGCGSNYKTLTDYINVIDPTNIEDIQGTSFSLYPNPASDIIFVRLKQGEINLIKIYDASGQIIYQKALQTNYTSIDISGFVSGVYVIEISTKEKVLTGTIIIK